MWSTCACSPVKADEFYQYLLPKAHHQSSKTLELWPSSASVRILFCLGTGVALTPILPDYRYSTTAHSNPRSVESADECCAWLPALHCPLSLIFKTLLPVTKQKLKVLSELCDRTEEVGPPLLEMLSSPHQQLIQSQSPLDPRSPFHVVNLASYGSYFA